MKYEYAWIAHYFVRRTFSDNFIFVKSFDSTENVFRDFLIRKSSF